VQHGIAKHDIGCRVRKRHLLDLAHLEVSRRQASSKRRRQPADVLDGFGILVECEHLAAFPQQVDEVAPIATTSVENRTARLNVAAQNLVEDVDIDLAELFLDAQRGAHGNAATLSSPGQ